MTGVEYSRKPPQHELIRAGGMSIVMLRENISEVERYEGTAWVCDEYSLQIQWRRGLDEDIGKNFDTWLEKAKALEAAKEAAKEQKRYERELEAGLAELLLDYDFRLMMLEELGGGEI